MRRPGLHPGPRENSRNQSIDPGFAIESRFADFSGGCLGRIFLPEMVRSTSGNREQRLRDFQVKTT